MNQNADINISVLFVEDNLSILMLYAKMLKKRVAQVFTAENGQAGLDLYLQHKPDLILTDISMPVMNGLEMIKKIKEVQPDIKVVVMSAYSNNEYFLEAINLGVNGYLLKPVEVAKLYAIIQELADGILLKKEREHNEQKRDEAEADIRRLLEGKDNLLRDAHRSMAKIMQVLTGMLEMHAHQVSDEDIKAVIHEIKNRIHPIALLHELFCQSDGATDIKIDDYVKRIVENIAKTHSGSQDKIMLNYEFADARFPFGIAIMFGLIVNELISIVFKYVFDGFDNGILVITLNNTGENAYQLQISSNDKGFENVELMKESNSHHLRVVQMLLNEIDGELSYDFASGSKLIIQFKI